MQMFQPSLISQNWLVVFVINRRIDSRHPWARAARLHGIERRALVLHRNPPFSVCTRCRQSPPHPYRRFRSTERQRLLGRVGSPTVVMCLKNGSMYFGGFVMTGFAHMRMADGRPWPDVVEICPPRRSPYAARDTG